ncbi:MAG: DUF2341 domain-containing protein [Gammaproteobacteria bacterium]|nr:MAG: DUF2341 domain-containing protein [Gammaproteobacteria bacterium]
MHVCNAGNPINIMHNNILHILSKIKSVLILLLLLCMQNICIAAWWDNNWNRNVSLQLTNSSGSNLINYPVDIDISASNLPGFDWNNNGDDLRVIDTDEITQLDFYIDSLNSATETATLWVNIPTFNNGEVRTIYIYYHNNAATNVSDAAATFSETGIKYHTRNTTFDPTTRAQAEADFNSLPDNVAGYGCTILNNITNIDNSGTFTGPNNDIIYFTETFFEVTAANAGIWEFRIGPDFGLGGDLYIDNQSVDAEWNDDLWWSFNFGNVNEILSGTTTPLPTGFHSFRTLGSEACCDGPASIEFRTPGGSFQELSAANLNLVTRQCPVENISTAFIGTEVLADISITKTDNINSYTPGGNTTYSIIVSNNGLVDVTNINVSDTLPDGVTVNGNWTCDPSIAPGDGTASCITGTAAGTTATGTGNINQNIDIPAGKSLVFSIPVNFSTDMNDY